MALPRDILAHHLGVTKCSALYFMLVFSVCLFQEYILCAAVNCRSIYVPFINAYKYTILQVQCGLTQLNVITYILLVQIVIVIRIIL